MAILGREVGQKPGVAGTDHELRPLGTFGSEQSTGKANRLPDEPTKRSTDSPVPVLSVAGEEKELHTETSENRYRELFHLAPIGYITLDCYNVISEANITASLILGVDRREMIGCRLCSFVAIDGHDTYYLNYQRLLEGVFPARCELLMLKGNGSSFYAHLESMLVEKNGQREVRIAMIDVTDRKQAEQEQIEKHYLAAISRLSGDLAHELRNTLAIIATSVFYLKSRLKDSDEKIAAHLERARCAVDRSTRIIQGIVNLTQVKEPRLVRLDLRSIVRDTIEYLHLQPHIKVNMVFPDREVIIDGDREQLKTAFAHIVTNAAEAMERGGTLTVTIQQNHEAELAFSDTGTGIPEENIAKLFNPLFTTKSTGTGLGLSITKRIVQKHSGTIQARSREGEGATFLIKLPCYRDQP